MTNISVLGYVFIFIVVVVILLFIGLLIRCIIQSRNSRPRRVIDYHYDHEQIGDITEQVATDLRDNFGFTSVLLRLLEKRDIPAGESMRDSK